MRIILAEMRHWTSEQRRQVGNQVHDFGVQETGADTIWGVPDMWMTLVAMSPQESESREKGQGAGVQRTHFRDISLDGSKGSL